ncbi:MAG: SPW repeat protein [Polaromonas sp.]
MKQIKHWQDPLNALLGVWVALSPWALGYQDTTVAMVNALVVGVTLVVVALGAIFVPRAWEEWTEVLLGMGLVMSPWLLGFNTLERVTLNTVFASLVIVALALWTLLSDKDVRNWMAHCAGWVERAAAV